MNLEPATIELQADAAEWSRTARKYLDVATDPFSVVPPRVAEGWARNTQIESARLYRAARVLMGIED